ncbi:MAG: reactive intermediate/imine deaminase [Armatimonadetes bacterium]|nr:reactive intermediate/imine deaminase [Armatimonadota bacterium]
MADKHAVESPTLPPAKGPYSTAIVAHGFVFVSGQGPIDPASGEVLRGDIQAQTRRVLENVQAILEATGSSLEKALKTTVFLANIDDFSAMNEVYASFFTSVPPARTTIQAAALPLGIDVEIDVIALLD